MLSDLFEFKVIFVREFVPFDTWYQEAMNLNSLLVKRQIDNPSPGAGTGGN